MDTRAFQGQQLKREPLNNLRTRNECISFTLYPFQRNAGANIYEAEKKLFLRHDV